MNRGVERQLRAVLAVVCILAAGMALRAERPRIYAIKGARIVVAPGKVIARGTVVIRDGLIEAVGADVTAPPDAVKIDAAGKTVYAGLIDFHSGLGLRRAQAATPAAGGGRGGGINLQALAAQQTREAPAGALHPLSRVRPETQATSLIVPFEGENTDSQRHRNLGFTAALVAPETGIFRGESALINLRDGTPATQIILKAHVAQHISLEMGGGGFGGGGGGGGGYPGSLMGYAAAIRQTLLDADRYQTWKKRYAANPAGMKRPDTSPALESLGPVLDRSRMVIFDLNRADDILLADRLAREFNLNAVMVGSGHDWELLDQIKATGRTLILPAAIPERPRVDDADDANEVETRDLKRYVNAPQNPKRLFDAKVRFALTTHGLRNPADFSRNVRRMIEAGLPAEAALAAVTTTPAEILGVASMMGTVETGKIANLIVTDGDLFAERTNVQQIFVDGYEYKNETPSRPRGDPNAVVDPIGTWTVNIAFGGRPITATWTIKGTRGNYSGSSETQGRSTDLTRVTLEGNALTVTQAAPGGRGSQEITVIITGETFEGTVEGPRAATVKGTRTAKPQGGDQ